MRPNASGAGKRAAMKGCVKTQRQNCVNVNGCVRSVKCASRGHQSASHLLKDKLLVVQFMHSGNEFPVLKCKRTNVTPSTVNGIFNVGWSCEESHHRRLVQHEGLYVDRSGKCKKGSLAFWTEWEAETSAKQIQTNNNFFKAHFVHTVKRPVALIGSGVCGSGNANKCPLYLNTDPCVFGKTFKYSNCHQSQNGELRRMAPGSLVVIGSYKSISLPNKKSKKEVFCLDTVFVVGDTALDYSTSNVNAVACSTYYKNLTLNRLPVGCDFTFYRGVSCRKNVNMKDALFSFTPAKFYKDGNGNKYNDRCVLDIESINNQLSKKIFSKRMRHGFKPTAVNEQEVKEIWDAIVKQVTDDDFVLGVYFM